MDHLSASKTEETAFVFNPATFDEPTRLVFENRIARNLWLGIKRHHEVGEHFTCDCLRIAEQVKKTPPATAEDLWKIFYNRGCDPIFRWYHHDSKALAEALLPHVRGEIDFAWTTSH